jgi:hypothetical protein
MTSSPLFARSQPRGASPNLAVWRSAWPLRLGDRPAGHLAVFPVMVNHQESSDRRSFRGQEEDLKSGMIAS